MLLTRSQSQGTPFRAHRRILAGAKADVHCTALFYSFSPWRMLGQCPELERRNTFGRFNLFTLLGLR